MLHFFIFWLGWNKERMYIYADINSPTQRNSD